MRRRSAEADPDCELESAPQLEKLVREKVESGKYNNASEVVREGLRLIEERDRRLERLRTEMQRGIDQIARGEPVLVDRAYLERVRGEIRRDSQKDRKTQDLSRG